MAIQIVTDATCDMPLEYISEHNLVNLPFPIRFGEEEYMIGLEPDAPGSITADAFYDRIAAGEVATTAQIPINMLEETFDRILAAGDDILYLGFDSALSGTISSANLVAREACEKYPDRKIRVVDTLSATLGEGMVVYLTVKKYEEEHPDLDTLADYAEYLARHAHHWFTVDDLHYLARGGRLSASAAFAGSLLKVKPILDCSIKGALIPRIKAIGQKKAMKVLHDKYMELAADKENMPMFIVHSRNQEGADELAAMIERSCGKKPDYVGSLTPIIAAHTGIGLVGVLFIGEKERFD